MKPARNIGDAGAVWDYGLIYDGGLWLEAANFPHFPNIPRRAAARGRVVGKLGIAFSRTRQNETKQPADGTTAPSTWRVCR
jgi:hypothetical protein